MITYSEHTLSNGLRVLANRDCESQMAAVNIIYCVGAKKEDPERTGFAHLFEHLMFRGTASVPDFDTPVQQACGENNAFTNNDYTDFYITLPKDNIETALWLESDRMTGLDISREALETEKSVVVEEFNQRYLNQPYGDQWLLLRDMVYKVHPYRWATIGLNTDHIRKASLKDVKAFYKRHYTPANAILSVSGNIAPERVFELSEKWFGGISGTPAPVDDIPCEPEQTAERRMEVERDVPADKLTMAFVMGDRLSRDFYMCDFMTDMLAGGSSARLYQHLVKERKLFSAVNAYITGDIDRGMFVLTGQLLPDVETADGEAAFWDELEALKKQEISDYESEKIKNKFEANTTFGELNVMNKAMNMGYYKMLGDMNLLNGEVAIFRGISADDVRHTAERMFTREHCSTLIMRRRR